MSVILTIDPGPIESAWLVYHPATGDIGDFGKVPNDYLLAYLRNVLGPEITCIVIEKVEGFGMAVGAEVFETVYWSGRFAEAAHPLPVERIGRKAVKLHLCGSLRAKDANIRAALLDRYGPGKQAAVGTKAHPGPLYGMAGDCWSALAVAVTWADVHAERGAA